MDGEYPFLEVRSPDGNEYIFSFPTGKHQIAIGRSADNDLVLPDPEKKVSRRHCTIEYAAGRWRSIDDGSANGTFLRQGGKAEIDARSLETIPLSDGDVKSSQKSKVKSQKLVFGSSLNCSQKLFPSRGEACIRLFLVILILGKLLPGDKPVFWELKFRDPAETHRIEGFQLVAQIEYNLSQKKLFRVARQHREEIKLSPQERDLIHYMAQQNQANNGRAIVCQYQELIKAIWDDSFGRTNNEINRLVWAVRDKIELDSGEPRFLKTVRGEGYLLAIEIV